jgi:4-amino-4-deoxy-L-arabinose transferase-like glycosyltransferase
MSHSWKPGKITSAIFMACVIAIILTITAPTIGLTFDETIYIKAADSNAQWMYMLIKDPVRALKADVIDTYWAYNHQSPPLEKIWSGIVWLVSRHFFNFIVANRLGVILLTAFLVALVYLIIAGSFGTKAGLFASVAMMSLPRFFFHAHLAELDVPVAVASFALTFLFWKTLDRKSWAWPVLWGIAWGLAVATKFNAVLVQIALLVWVILFRRKWSVFLRLILMCLVAIPTFFLSWPWLYYHTWSRVVDYVNFYLHHGNLGQWYYGQFYLPPPWHFVFVMLWAVVPLTVMALFLIGIVRGGNGKRDGGLAWLMTLCAFVSISPFIFGKNLVYDNERLFMSIFPYLAALAGIGFGWLVASLSRHLISGKWAFLINPISLVLGIALVTPQVVSMVGLYPHLLSYYSEGVGGLPGATKLGLETTYWGETFVSAIPFINAHAKPGDAIWIEDKAVPLMYQDSGFLRQDVWFMSKYPQSLSGQEGYGVFGEADWYVFQYYQTIYGPSGEAGYLPLQILSHQTPVFEVSYRGVPLLKIYRSLK